MYAGATKFDKLSSEMREDIDLILIDRLQDALRGASQRNDDEADYDDLLEGAQMEGMPLPWPNACNLVSTLIPEHITTLQANLCAFLRQETLAEASSRRLEDKERARNTEIWLNDVWREEGIRDTLYHYTRNILKSKSAVVYSGWCERVERVHKTKYAEYDEDSQWFRYWNEATGAPDDLVDAEERLPDAAYVAVPATEDKETKGAETRVVDLSDFYLYPANAESVEKATCVFERMLLTEDDLLTGIDTYGYDKEVVAEILRMGPTHDSSGGMTNFEETSDRQRMDDMEGVDGQVMTRGDGYYECFLGFGRLPKLWEDGEAQLPEEYFQQEAQMLLCPQYNLVPLLVPCKYPRKPYFMRSLLPKNRRALGGGMVQRLEPLAQEATHIIRQTFNGMDIAMMPEFKVTDAYAERNKTKSSFPGKYHRVDMASDIEPLVKDPSARLGFEPLAYVDSKAQALAASQGFGELQTKVRKNAEVQNAVGAATTKFDLYAYNTYGQMVPDLAAWRVEMQLMFDPDFTAYAGTMEGELEITAEDLQAGVRWTAAQMDSANTPQAKEIRNQAKLNIQLGFMKAKREFPEDAESLWYGARQALVDLAERNPEKWIGEKPAPMMPMGMGMMPGMPPGMGATPGGGMEGIPGMGGMPQFWNGTGTGSPAMNGNGTY